RPRACCGRRPPRRRRRPLPGGPTPRPTTPTSASAAARGAPPRAAAGLRAPSDVAEAFDQTGGVAVRVELSGHQIAGTHPASAGPLAERDAGARPPGRRRQPPDPLGGPLHRPPPHATG